jgi:hypothetical protein
MSRIEDAGMTHSGSATRAFCVWCAAACDALPADEDLMLPGESAWMFGGWPGSPTARSPRPRPHTLAVGRYRRDLLSVAKYAA